MTSLRLTLARFGNPHVVALLASSALLTVGCSNMESTATSTPIVSGALMTGRVHGGNNPVSDGGVLLYAVGQTGLGSAPTLYAYTTTATDGTGSFSFVQTPGTAPSGQTGANSNPYGAGGNTYQCPSGVQPLMYIYAAGGNTTGNPSNVGANNTAAAFLAPVGYCNQINNSTFVDVSEVTTAATVAAAAQFINPNNDGIGNDGIGVAYEAIGNAFATIPNLVNAANGLANTTTTMAGSGTGVSGVTMSITSPAATVNTIADILAACVNQISPSSANCVTLFNNATPPPNPARQSQPNITYGAAGDTIQAALYMYLYPTDGSTTNRTNLFNLVAAAGAPFQPTLPSVPGDWLLAITYTASGTCGTSASSFFSHPYDLNVDIDGNLWIANKATTNGALVQMTPYGLAQNCQSLGGSSEGGGVVDIAASIWYTDNANSLIWTYPTNASLGGSTRSFVSPAPPVAITTDGSGNIFFTTTNGTTGSLYEIVDGYNVNNTSSPVLLSSGYNVGPNPIRMFPDASNNIWVTSGSGYVTEFHETSTATYSATQFSVVGPTYGLTVGSAAAGSNVYVTSQDANSTFTILSPVSPGSTTYAVSFTSSANIGGLSSPTGIWLDGGMSSWISNNAPETSGLYAVSEIASNGTSISPTGTNGGYQKPTTVLNGGRTSVVDPIGNVWILNDNLPNSVTQIVGAAVPIYAPYSTGLQNARFQTIP
jgi:hypothetical protein